MPNKQNSNLRGVSAKRSGLINGSFTRGPFFENDLVNCVGFHDEGTQCKILKQYFAYKKKDIIWEADAGLITDGATIPKWAQPIIGKPFDREFAKAATLHDHYCRKGLYASYCKKRTGNEAMYDYYCKKGAKGFKDHYCRGGYQIRNYKDTHRMFYDALLDTKEMGKFKALVMYAAVWFWGPKWTLVGSVDKKEYLCTPPVNSTAPSYSEIDEQQIMELEKEVKIILEKARSIFEFDRVRLEEINGQEEEINYREFILHRAEGIAIQKRVKPALLPMSIPYEEWSGTEE